MSIQAIIWDLGGVLVRTEDYGSRLALATRLGQDRLALEDLVFGGDSGHAAQSGRVALAEHWLNVMRQVGLTQDDLLAFQAEFFGGDVVDYALIDYIRSLRGRYKIGLLSNAFSDLRQLIAERWKFPDVFDDLVISAEVGMMKPDPRIYALAVARLGSTPEGTVFIDDFTRNTTAAQDAGLHAIHFRSPTQARQELEALLNGRRADDPQ